MNHAFKLMICFVLLFSSILFSQSDSTNTITRLELKDGSVLMGQIISEDETSIIFKTSSDIEITINKATVKNRELIKGEYNKGEFWNADPNTTRLFFAPTGKMLKPGSGYFSIYEVFLPFVAVGLTDYLLISGGFSLFPGVNKQIAYISPKIGFEVAPDINLAGGVLYMRLPDSKVGAGIIYSVGSYSSNMGNVTVGFGHGFAGGEMASKPIIMLGGDFRLAKGLKFLSENWIIPGESFNLYSFGLRFYGERLAADIALIYPGESMGGFPFLPWIGFAYNF